LDGLKREEQSCLFPKFRLGQLEITKLAHEEAMEVFY
jgi:hypothetical protein